jgi:hypothetical protein
MPKECEYIAEEDDVGDIGYAHFLDHLDDFRHNKFLNIGEYQRWASNFRGWAPSVRGGHEHFSKWLRNCKILRNYRVTECSGEINTPPPPPPGLKQGVWRS